MFLSYFLFLNLLTPLLGVLSIVMHGEHIVVLNAVLEQIDGSIPTKLLNIFLQALLHKDFNIGSQPLPQGAV